MLYVDSGNRARTVRTAIYTSLSGHPGMLLTSGLRRRPAAGTWNAFQVRAATLHTKQIYWVALLGTGGRIGFRDGISRGCSSQGSRRALLQRFPSRWESGPHWSTCRVSAYVLGRALATPPRQQHPPPASKKPTPTATAPAPPTSGTRTNCISKPSACGYPDATNTGVPAGTHLTASGPLTLSRPGVYSGLNVNGRLTVTSTGVTIKDSVITGPCDNSNFAIFNEADGTVIKDTTLKGSNSTDCALAAGVQNAAGPITLKRVQAYNLDSAQHGVGTIEDSYFLDNAEIPGEHYEPIFYGGGEGALVVDHNTLLNPHEQTACVFAWNNYGDENGLAITNNLMAGGGYILYGGGDPSIGPTTNHATITGNRFSKTYFPKGGFYGVDANVNESVTTWSGNYWDDTLAPVGP